MSHSLKLAPISQQSIDEHTTKFKSCSSMKQYIKLKSDSHLPKKFLCLLQWKPFKNAEKCFLISS